MRTSPLETSAIITGLLCCVWIMLGVQVEAVIIMAGLVLGAGYIVKLGGIE